MNKSNLDYIRKINGTNPNKTNKENYIDDMVDDYEIVVQDVITRFSVRVNTSDAINVFINDNTKPIKSVIDIKKKYGANAEQEETIQVYPNLIKTGDYLKFARNETDSLHNYIITSKINKHKGYDEGVFVLCNQTISWKDENGKVYCHPCNVGNNSYGAKITNTSDIYGETSQRCDVTIQNNADTLKFLRQDFRFILSHSDSDIYKITNRDVGINDGIITLTCNKDVLKNEDDLENNIAYNSKVNNETDNEEPQDTTYTITGNTNLIKGKQQTYELNEEMQGIEWILDEISIEAELAEIISQDDKTCILSTSCGDGEIVTLSCYLDNKEMASIDLICVRK